MDASVNPWVGVGVFVLAGMGLLMHASAAFHPRARQEEV